ncbi:Helix-loop-helix DNA-binding domain [Geosmithia morbida]|uniref:Helix-loop-helix DNA-binding domain n=1 Tax=Geosmithia morbida TaxID=1094350 RepID=A0A9P4YVM5_9HYPO|nr:Helix-loop-helix DNA-binding domain [Geosmithia morbida]KAF4122518.1 Helix-loop-helix DNA-binding domain [Geosmithia morbida]
MEAQPRPQPPKAAGLTNILNKEEHPASTNGAPPLRDSGFYSTADVSSKHTSAASFVNGMSPAPSGYQSSIDKTPSPVAGHVSHSLVSPPASHMSVASMVSPASSHGPEIRRPEHQSSMESTQSASTLAGGPDPALLSRRESVDSRINQGLSDMRLGNSPYATHNHSTTSIQNTLNSQRHPRAGLDAPPVQRISNGYAPSAERNPESRTARTAPAITGPATGHIARAAEPTKGQAWAFPEEETIQTAINEHRHQKEYIQTIQAKYQALAHENDVLRRELQAYRGEAPGSQYRDASSQPPPPPPSASAPAPPPSQHAGGPYEYAAAGSSSSSRTELPPLRSLSSSIHGGGGPDSMMGVQYDTPGSANGYRQERY